MPQKEQNRHRAEKNALCNFDLDLLPIRLSLPMVCPPRDWESKSKRNPRTMDDLHGGYLSKPTNALYLNRFNLLTTRDNEHLSILFEG